MLRVISHKYVLLKLALNHTPIRVLRYGLKTEPLPYDSQLLKSQIF